MSRVNGSADWIVVTEGTLSVALSQDGIGGYDDTVPLNLEDMRFFPLRQGGEANLDARAEHLGAFMNCLTSCTLCRGISSIGRQIPLTMIVNASAERGPSRTPSACLPGMTRWRVHPGNTWSKRSCSQGAEWGGWDSNPRPTDYESAALTG